MKTLITLLIYPLALAFLTGCVDVSLEENTDGNVIETRSNAAGEDGYDYDELADLFKEDVRMLDSLAPMTSARYFAPAAPFTHSAVLSLGRNLTTSTGIEKILIIVDSSIYEQLRDEVERYAFDIYSAFGCAIVMERVSGGNPIDVKNLILTYKTNLSGVVLIGDIPAARFEIEDDHYKYGHRAWPCDLYYTDLDGSWGDSNGNGIYDTHTGNIGPEIYLGRISTKNMGTLVSEKEGLVRYFDKNHDFWCGLTTVNRKSALTYVDKDWIPFPYYKHDIQYLYGAANYVAKGYGDAGFGRAEYLSNLRNRAYEFIQLCCHASYMRLAMTGGSIYANEIYENGTDAIGYNLFCCSACDWTSVSTNSPYGFLAGAHIYNPQNRSLVAVGSTKTGSMLKFKNFYTPLGQGKTIGESLKIWWSGILNDEEHYRISWFYGMTIIGDPLINFLYRVRSTSRIVLNSFDTDNSATYRYVKASEEIQADNYAIPAGMKVIFNAPSVIMNAGFTCNPESTLVINNT